MLKAQQDEFQKLDFSLHLGSFKLQAHQEEAEKKAVYWEYNLRIRELRGGAGDHVPTSSGQPPACLYFLHMARATEGSDPVNTTLPLIMEEEPRHGGERCSLGGS